MNNLINHKKLTKQILQSAYEIHKNLGCGFSKEVYIKALCMELVMRGLNVENQKNVGLRYKGNVIGEQIIDMVVEGKVIIQLKDGDRINKADRLQLMNFLEVSGIDVGLAINFSRPKLDFKRVMFQALVWR